MKVSRKQMIIGVSVYVLLVGTLIALIAYFKSDLRVKNIFKNNRQTFEQAADYLVEIAENYPDDTAFTVLHWNIDFEHYDNRYDIRDMKTGKQIEWRQSDLPDKAQEQALYKAMGLFGTSGLHMTKRRNGCIISFGLNNQSDEWREIVYSTDPNRKLSAELQNAALEEYDYSNEKIAENGYFWYVSG